MRPACYAARPARGCRLPSLGRFSTTEEIANMVVYVCSQQAPRRAVRHCVSMEAWYGRSCKAQHGWLTNRCRSSDYPPTSAPSESRCRKTPCREPLGGAQKVLALNQFELTTRCFNGYAERRRTRKPCDFDQTRPLADRPSASKRPPLRPRLHFFNCCSSGCCAEPLDECCDIGGGWNNSIGASRIADIR